MHEFTARWRNRLEKVFGTYDEEPLITDLSLLEVGLIAAVAVLTMLNYRFTLLSAALACTHIYA